MIKYLIKFHIILFFLSVLFTTTVAATEFDFEKAGDISKKISNKNISRLNVDPTDNDPQIFNAYKKAKISFYNNKVNQYVFLQKEREHDTGYRQKVFKWHYISSIAIFFVVIAIIVIGLYFSYLQFKSSYEKNMLDYLPVNEFEIGKDGIKISSSVIGLIVLFLSLGFFYLYLTEVYPVQLLN